MTGPKIDPIVPLCCILRHGQLTTLTLTFFFFSAFYIFSYYSIFIFLMSVDSELLSLTSLCGCVWTSCYLNKFFCDDRKQKKN